MAGIGVQVEFNIGGTWTDVTGDVRTSDLIKINGGRRDEASAVTPSTCTFKLNNRDGRYSDSNPMSPYFGLLGRNTPLRVSVTGQETYLALDGDPTGRAQTPDTAALDITGDLDVRFEITTDWYAPGQHTIIGKYDDPNNQRSWQVRLVDGQVRFVWSTDGTDTPFAFWTLPPGLPDRYAGRVVMDVDDGAGHFTVAFYTADSIDGPWVEQGTTGIGTGTTSIFASTAPLQVAPYYEIDGAARAPFTGRGHRFEVRNGIDGPVAAGVDFSTVPAGATSFTGTAGLPWTVDGTAEVTAREPRFTGEVSAWPQRWDVSGVDVWVPISAAGVLRRLGQGTKALQSTLRRRIPSASPAPIAYWPMEEGADAVHASSPLAGVPPLTTSGMQWASASGLPSSAPLPTLDQTASLRASFGDTGTGGWQVEMVYKAPDMPSSLEQLWRVNLSGGAASYLLVFVGNNSIRLETHDSDGNLLVGFTTANPAWIDSYSAGWTRMQLYAGVDGTNAAYWAVSWHDIEQDVFHPTYIYDAVGTLPGRITALVGSWGQDFAGFALGHLAVFDVPGTSGHLPTLDVYNGADDAFAGETTIDRMRRLSTEEGLPLRLTGDPAQTELVGPQRVDTILALLQSAADVDGGLLHEQRDSLTLAYRARHTLYNQPVALVLDYSARGEVMPPLEPTEDDQATRNDVTVRREGGSSAQSVQETGPLNVQDPPAGVGRYDTEVTLNAADDWQLLDLAGWAVHLGTWAGARYPTVHVALHAAPWLTQQVLAMRLLDRIQIANTPSWLPPGVIDLLAEGYTEILGPYTWDITFNCSPAGPWTVGVVGDDVLGRADTDGTVLADAVGPDDTVLPVRVTAGAQWTTDPAEFPFDLRVGGEVVTATACSTPQGTPMPAGVDSTTDTTGATAIAPSVDADEAGDLLVCAWVPWDGVQAYTPPASMTRQTDTAGVWSVLTDATETLAAGGATGTRTATRTANTAWAALSVAAAGAPVIEEHLADIASDAAKTHAPGPVTLTTAAGTQAGWWLVALHGFDNAGGTASAAPDGAGWIELAVSGYGNASKPFMGAWVKRAVGGAETVTYPQGAADDNHARLYVVSGATDLSAQLMTVVRAVNGITKPQAAGSDVRLAQPSIVAL